MVRANGRRPSGVTGMPPRAQTCRYLDHKRSLRASLVKVPQRQAIASSDDPDPIHADLDGVWLFLSLFLRLKLDLVLIAPAMIASWSGLGGRVRWFIPDRGREAQLEAQP